MRGGLRAEKDLKANLEQPLLRLPEVAAVTDLVAPGPQTARFLAEVDRLCFPELLKALSTAAFDELEAHFRELLPGIRTFVHDDGGGEPAAADDPPPRRAPSAKALWATSTSWSKKGVASEKGAPPAADLDRDAVDRLDAPGALPEALDAPSLLPGSPRDGADALEAGAAHRATDEAWLRDVGPRDAPDAAAARSPRDAADDAAAPGDVGVALREAKPAGAAAWPTRCLLKCSPDVSIKKTTRMAAKIDEYEKEKGEGRYPYCAFVGDSLRASVVCEDAEAFWKTYCALKGDPDDPKQRFKVLRLKNKLGKGREPFNFHLNCSFQPSTFKAPVQLEIQIWASSIMDLNDVSHWQYEVARASTADAF